MKLKENWNDIEMKLKWNCNKYGIKVNKLKRDEMNRNEMKQNKIF